MERFAMGVSYYAYQPYLTYPQGMTWQVCDVPAVVRTGRELASVRDERRVPAAPWTAAAREFFGTRMTRSTTWSK